MKKILGLLIVIVLLTIGYYYFAGVKSLNKQTPTTPITEIYFNKKYKYSFSYSNNFKIRATEEEERLPANESSSILVSNEKNNSYVIIEAVTSPTTSPSFNLDRANSNKNFELLNKNSNFPNKTVTEIEKITLKNNVVAYFFIVKNYTDSFGNSDYKVTFVEKGNTVLNIQSNINNSDIDEIIKSIEF